MSRFHLLVREQGEEIARIGEEMCRVFRPWYPDVSNFLFLDNYLYRALVFYLPLFLENSILPEFYELVQSLDQRHGLVIRFNRSYELLRYIISFTPHTNTSV